MSYNQIKDMDIKCVVTMLDCDGEQNIYNVGRSKVIKIERGFNYITGDPICRFFVYYENGNITEINPHAIESVSYVKKNNE